MSTEVRLQVRQRSQQDAIRLLTGGIGARADCLGFDTMSILTYSQTEAWRNAMSPTDEPLVWFAGEIRTPPFSQAARIEAGLLLRRLQKGETLSMPHSRPMPSIGQRWHELRIHD